MTEDTALILGCPPETSTLVNYHLACSWRKQDPEINAELGCDRKRRESASVSGTGKKRSGSSAWRSPRKEDATKPSIFLAALLAIICVSLLGLIEPNIKDWAASVFIFL